MKRFIAGSAAAAALLAISTDGAGQSRTDTVRADGEQIKVVGCLVREDDYARSVGAATVPRDPAAPVQLVLTARAGATAYSITGTREADLASHVGRRVEVAGTVEAVRFAAPVRGTAAPVAGTAGRVAAGEPPTGAQGITPDGSPSHEPGDAVPGTDPTPESTVRVPSASAAASTATRPRLNVVSFHVVAGECDPLPPRSDQGATKETAIPGVPAANAPGRPPQPAAFGRTAPEVRTVTARGCLVRQTPAGAAVSAQDANTGGRFVLTGADVNAARTTTSASAVPGSAPSGSGSGTIPPSPSSSDADLTGEQSLEIAVPQADRSKLARYVGQRVEIVGTIDAAPSGRTDPARTGSAAAGTGGRIEAGGAVAHPSAPLQRITMTSMRVLGGSC